MILVVEWLAKGNGKTLQDCIADLQPLVEHGLTLPPGDALAKK